MKVLLGGIGEAFEDRNFRIYPVGAIVSWLSFFVQVVAVSWTTWELTHSTVWLSVVALADVAPNIVWRRAVRGERRPSVFSGPSWP